MKCIVEKRVVNESQIEKRMNEQVQKEALQLVTSKTKCERYGIRTEFSSIGGSSSDKLPVLFLYSRINSTSSTPVSFCSVHCK